MTNGFALTLCVCVYVCREIIMIIIIIITVPLSLSNWRSRTTRSKISINKTSRLRSSDIEIANIFLDLRSPRGRAQESTDPFDQCPPYEKCNDRSNKSTIPSFRPLLPERARRRLLLSFPAPPPTPKWLHIRKFAVTAATNRGLRIPLCHISRHLQASLSSPTACHSQNRKALILQHARKRYRHRTFGRTHLEGILAWPRTLAGYFRFLREVTELRSARSRGEFRFRLIPRARARMSEICSGVFAQSYFVAGVYRDHWKIHRNKTKMQFLIPKVTGTPEFANSVIQLHRTVSTLALNFSILALKLIRNNTAFTPFFFIFLFRSTRIRIRYRDRIKSSIAHIERYLEHHFYTTRLITRFFFIQ